MASSKEAAVLATEADDDDDAAVLEPCDMRDWRTCRTACGRILFGSAADGFVLLINLRRFDDMPEMYASLNALCGLWGIKYQHINSVYKYIFMTSTQSEFNWFTHLTSLT